MKVKPVVVVSFILAFVLVWSLSSYAADPIQLPSPQTEGGKPLMQTLKERMTIRTFGDEKLSMQTLSNLLWAAFGINRPDGRRTAPSAVNWQEIEIYVAMPDGLFLWDAQKNRLNPILAKDVRAMTGGQPYVKDAAVNPSDLNPSSRWKSSVFTCPSPKACPASFMSSPAKRATVRLTAVLTTDANLQIRSGLQT